MTEIYHYDQINAETEVYGVIADPIGHSLSPLIHNAAFAQLKLNKVYVPFRVPREDLAQFIDDAPALGIKGLSVTIPHKEEVVKKLTEADGAVRGIGAANTVVFDGPSGRGYNTDYRAAMSSLEEAMGVAGKGEQAACRARRPWCSAPAAWARPSPTAWSAAGRRSSSPTALPQQGRAAGQAVRVPLGRLGRPAHASPPTCWSTARRSACTPTSTRRPFDKHHLRPSMVVFDAVYNPENTLLIKDARSRNCTVVTGVDMFVRQACLQFKLFTGQDGPADLMRDVIKRAIGAAKYAEGEEGMTNGEWRDMP